jgi:hypothetical protein
MCPDVGHDVRLLYGDLCVGLYCVLLFLFTVGCLEPTNLQVDGGQGISQDRVYVVLRGLLVLVCLTGLGGRPHFTYSGWHDESLVACCCDWLFRPVGQISYYV